MTEFDSLPRILIVDDLYGRKAPHGANRERQDFCRTHRIIDVTGDQPSSMQSPTFSDPVAVAVFIRGQEPANAGRGATVRNDLQQVLNKVAEGEPRRGRLPWALILVDLVFATGKVTEASEAGSPGMPAVRTADRDHPFGLDVLSALTERFPDLPVAVLTSVAREDVKREYVNRGAVGFLEKDHEQPAAALRQLVRQQGLVPDPAKEVVGESHALLFALREARRAAAHRRPVLVLGERGTGKERLAKYIHQQRDLNQRFIAINCGQFSDPDNAFSALFGHKKGSFTGALSDRQGLVLAARGGILFLDEISSLPLNVQQGLHRLIQEREVAPFGAQEHPLRDVDVKVLAASNVDLDDLARKGRFMADLLDRLKSGTVIHLPPLRDRLSDLPLLVDLFVRQEEKALGAAARKREWDDSVYRHLEECLWPGNIRELESCLKQAVSSHPDIDILHPRWIRLPDDSQEATDFPRLAPDRRSSSTSMSPFDLLAGVQFDPTDSVALTGRLDDVLRVLAKYLDAVVQATSTRTATEPEGIINTSAATRIMIGKALKSSQPADLIKRYLKVLESRGLLTNVLQRAYDRAREIRDGASVQNGQNEASPDAPSAIAKQ